MRRITTLGYVTSFILVPLFIFWSLYQKEMTTILQTRWGILRKGKAYYTEPWAMTVSNPSLVYSKPDPRLWAGIEDLRKFGTLGTPFGSASAIDHFLKLSGHYRPAYHIDSQMILTPASLKRELTSIGQMPRLLVPTHLLDSPNQFDEQSYNQSYSVYLTKLLFYPVRFHEVKTRPFIARAEIVEFIQDHFTVEARWESYLVMAQPPDKLTELAR